jgi:hypothetical protein
VTATNDAGYSNDSQVIDIKAADSPSTMQAPIKIYADTTQIQLGWSAPSDTGYSDVVGYRVYFSENDYALPIYDTADSSILQFTLSAPELTSGGKYSFAVSAYNDITESDTSNIVLIIAATEPS